MNEKYFYNRDKCPYCLSEDINVDLNIEDKIEHHRLIITWKCNKCKKHFEKHYNTYFAFVKYKEDDDE